MRILTPFLVVALLASGGTITYFKKQNSNLKNEITILKYEKNKIEEDAKTTHWNDENTIAVTKEQYAKSKASWKIKLDSVTKANNIRAIKLISATIIDSKYIDTTEVAASLESPVKWLQSKDSLLHPIYRIPTSFESKCWGMNGYITTTDSTAKFTLTKRIANNSVQQIITERKKFLWWTIRKPQYLVFSDCGEPLITTVVIKD
jgi:hypothetical protein